MFAMIIMNVKVRAEKCFLMYALHKVSLDKAILRKSYLIAVSHKKRQNTDKKSHSLTQTLLYSDPPADQR